VWPLAAIAMAFVVAGGIIDAAIYLRQIVLLPRIRVTGR
jgi:hypothetical protein